MFSQTIAMGEVPGSLLTLNSNGGHLGHRLLAVGGPYTANTRHQMMVCIQVFIYLHYIANTTNWMGYDPLSAVKWATVTKHGAGFHMTHPT